MGYFFLAKHVKTVLRTRKNEKNLDWTFWRGVGNYGIVHSIISEYMHPRIFIVRFFRLESKNKAF